MPQIPEPNYDYDIEKLVRAYRKAIRDILRELERLDLTDISRANSQAALAHVVEILRELDGESLTWLEEIVPKAVLDGVAGAVFALGVTDTFEEAKTIAKFNRLNKDLVKTVISDTQSDLLAVTQNIERKVRSTIRQVVAESMRANMSAGINGRRTISRDILKGMRDQLGDSVNTGIIDAANRRWRPEVYTDMVVRTKMMRAHMEAMTNEALSRDVMYGQISAHGAKDNCRLWESKIVKLVEGAPGNYPLLANLYSSRDIFHPNCKHIVSPIRNPEDA